MRERAHFKGIFAQGNLPLKICIFRRQWRKRVLILIFRQFEKALLIVSETNKSTLSKRKIVKLTNIKGISNIFI